MALRASALSYPASYIPLQLQLRVDTSNPPRPKPSSRKISVSPVAVTPGGGELTPSMGRTRPKKSAGPRNRKKPTAVTQSRYLWAHGMQSCFVVWVVV